MSRYTLIQVKSDDSHAYVEQAPDPLTYNLVDKRKATIIEDDVPEAEALKDADFYEDDYFLYTVDDLARLGLLVRHY